MFSRYHYLDHKHNKAARVYVCYINDQPAGFISVLPQPGQVKATWRVHRLVVLPDYQGIGIGLRILNDIAKLYTEDKKVFRIVTSAPSLLRALNNHPKWRCISFGRKLGGGLMSGSEKRAGIVKIISTAKRMSASFYYKE